MRTLTAITLCLVLVQPAYPVAKKKCKYMGGTAAIKHGKEGRIVHASKAVQFAFKQAIITVPYEQVTIIEYGQGAGRRVGQTIGLAVLIGPFALPLLLTKRRRHYLSVAWTDDDGGRHAAVVELGKSVNRSVINTLALSSGVPIDFEDEKAKENFGK